MTPNRVADFATRETLVKTLVGFCIAGIVLVLAAQAVGQAALRRSLASADPAWVAVACLSTLACLLSWGKAWQVVLEVTGVEVPYSRLSVTYLAATFANYVTPLGQAGGEPFIAYVLARDTEASYEESLASVVTADMLNLLPFFSFAGVGLSVLLLRAELPEAVRPLVWGLLGMAVGVPAVVVTGWRFRHRVRSAVLGASEPLARRTSRLDVATVSERIDDLYAAFGRIAADRHALAQAVAFAYVGWIFFALPLYFAARALGLTMEPWLVLFVVPASTLAGLVPSPGGLGGVEIALVALLIAVVPGIGAAPAFAVALVYRFASYWFALGIGGGAAMWVVKRT